MNLLVYKGDAQTTSARQDLNTAAPPDASISEILMTRLAVKDEERYSDYSERQMFEKAASKAQQSGGKLS